MNIRRTFALSAVLAAAALALSATNIKPPIDTTPPTRGCHSKGVSVHTFYGQTADLTGYVGQLAEHPLSSRVRVVVVESAKGARVRLFERQDDGYAVSSWQGESVGSMRAEWDALILKSRGNSCAGADLAADLRARGFDLKADGKLAEASNASTLTPMAQESGYLRMSVYDPCE